MKLSKRGQKTPSGRHQPVREPEKPGRPVPALAWSPEDPGVWIERDPESETKRISMIRHPTHPYPGESHVDLERVTPFERKLLETAFDYLVKVNKNKKSRFIPNEWLLGLNPDTNSKPDDPSRPLRWLPFSPPCVPKDRIGTSGSFWLRRYKDADPGKPVLNETAVLLAGFVVGETALLGGQGLSVIAHVDRQGSVVRIIGLFNTLPLVSDVSASTRVFSGRLGKLINVGFLNRTLPLRLKEAFALDEDEMEVVQVGVRIPQEFFGAKAPEVPYFEIIAKTAARTDERTQLSVRQGSDETGYALVGRFWHPGPQGLEAISKRPLRAHATDAKVYAQDPISKQGPEAYRRLRPNKSWLVLNPERVPVTFPELTPINNRVTLTMQDAAGNPWFTVTRSPFVERIPEAHWNDPESLQVSQQGGRHVINASVRTNAFAAINAYYRAREFFRRLVDYGLPPRDYFNFVELPLRVRYRAGIEPGGTDGKTINAQVRFNPKWQLDPKNKGTLTPGRLEVRFALGDLECSHIRSPLGIVCDPRWSWHEFCHVLLAAATGELEFPFAHSAGDAIAAILCDPESELARDREWRGTTFPWVSVSRRHDRDPSVGWSWQGSLNEREKFFADPPSDRQGYWAEQILSTTLFRLYRAIGGDTEEIDSTTGKPRPDKKARQAAADYVVYLITQGLRLPAPTTVASLSSAEQFLFALQAVDLGTPAIPTGMVSYPGGSVHKVIQWAFERQGLYGPHLEGPLDPLNTNNNDGIYIEDRRDKQYDGTYAPISFLPKPKPHADWHAPDSAIWVRRMADGNQDDQPPTKNQPNHVYVSVCNKRTNLATSVFVEVWVAALENGEPPAFRRGSSKWTSLGAETSDVPKATGPTMPGRKTFGPFKWTNSGIDSYALLVSASWVGDRSNLDTASLAPCANAPQPLGLKHIVACDDNLALRVVKVN